MHSTKADHLGVQEQATVDEYASTVREGNAERQWNIREANPDLTKQFDHVDANTNVTV